MPTPESAAKALAPEFMKAHQVALYPFSILYDGATRLRNRLFELNYRKSYGFGPVVINVGNLSAGGTGKTPMTEYLIRLLHRRYKVATLSRGYGRKTKGFRLAGSQDSAATLGDEPFQLYKAWKEDVVVAVGEKRAEAIPQIMAAHPNTEVILLDDAYQHRAVKRDLNILLTTWEKPFFQDYVLPAGRLRESRKGAERADMVVVTKCPSSLTPEMILHYRKNIQFYAGNDVPVFFSTLEYDEPQLFNPVQGGQSKMPERLVLVSGLAKAQPFEEQARKKGSVLRHFRYPDHYAYKAEDLEKIVAFVGNEKGCGILTTEKDAVKWAEPRLRDLLSEVPVFTLPVRHLFIEGKQAFEGLVLNIITEQT